MASKYFSEEENPLWLPPKDLPVYNYVVMNSYIEPICPACGLEISNRCFYVWQAAQCPNKIKREIKGFLKRQKPKIIDDTSSSAI